jgi:hypothetical protein
MTRLAPVLLIATALAASTAAPAQDTSTDMSQISSASDAPMAQISTATDPVVAAASAPATAEAPSQLGSASESASPTPQLTRASETRGAYQQVSKGDRDARAPQPLSRPADGRTSAVERVAGHDRCDPAKDKTLAKGCANVIENRAAQYSRREAPELSPEQKLLARERTRENAATSEAAARRLANTGQSDQSLQSLGVASMVLTKPAEPPKRDQPAQPAPSDATQAIINAIVSGASTPPLRP